MKQAEEKETHGYSLLQAIQSHIPWKDIFFGLFIPLNLLYGLIYLKMPLAAIFVSLGCSLLYCAVYSFITGKFSSLSLMTSAMIVLGFLTSFLRGHPLLYILAETFDKCIVGFIFLASLATAKPFVLLFIDEGTIARIPEKIRMSSYHLKAWKIITAAWGIAFVLAGALGTFLEATHSRGAELVDYCAGWPMVIVLFMFSVNFPHYYWMATYPAIEAEMREK
jgi:hypothetical protein